MNIKAVIFDLDNTIVDRTRTFRGFVKTFIDTYFGHLEETQTLFDRIIDLDQDGYKNKKQLFSELLDELQWKEKPRIEELLDFYATHYVENAVLMDQAREVLGDLRKKYKTGLITNGLTAIQYGKIDHLGIRNEFDLILVSEEAGVKKPDPRIFQMALDHFGFLPQECIYIGDHPVNDIEGAARVGMKTIWMKVNQPWREGLSASPMHTIKEINELIDLL